MTDLIHDVSAPPATGRSVRRRLVIAASLALVVFAAVSSLFIVRGVDMQMVDVETNHAVRKQARDLVQALTDAETGQRGYLLTLEEAYLEPYREAMTTIDETYSGLLAMVEDEPVLLRAVEGLAETIARKRAEMATTITMAMDGRVNEAMTILRSDAGLNLMGPIRETLREMIASEDQRLIERNASVAQLRAWLIAMIIMALGGAAVLTYLLLSRTQRVVSSLSRTHSELQTQKAELESRVRERTAQLEEARAHAERERARVESLLQETNHRVGNSLATVSSLLGLQVARTHSEEVRRALEAAQNRVQAIASGHRRLRLGDDLETANAAEFLASVVEGGHRKRMASGVSVSNNLLGEGHMPHADLVDGGVLGVYVAKPMNAIRTAWFCIRVLLGHWKGYLGVSEDQVTQVTLTFPTRKRTAQAVIDGELIPLEDRVEIRIHPRALRVLAPQALAEILVYGSAPAVEPAA